MGCLCRCQQKKGSGSNRIDPEGNPGLKDTLTEEELERAKNHLKGNIILGLESTSSRMNNIARQEIYYGKYFSPKEIMSEIDSIKLQQIKELAEGP